MLARSVIVSRLIQALVRAGADRSAAVGILVAAASTVIFLLLGFTIDYAYASYVNQRLARAADSAVLAAVSQTAATTAGGYANTSYLQTYGTNIFNENVKTLSLSNVNWNLAVTSTSDGGASAVGTFTYAVPTFFAKILGADTIPVSGRAASQAKPVTYVNYYILVDTSQSMGVAATQADMLALFDRVVAKTNGSNGETGCVFGCHVRAPKNDDVHDLQPYSNEDLAHNLSTNFGPRITLRIDAAITAIQNIITDASNASGTLGNIRFALYTIQANPSDGSYYKNVAPLSNNFATLSNQANNITLGANNAYGYGDSDFSSELTAFNNGSILPTTNGSGTSASSPLNFVFIVTDGLFDSCTNTHCTSILDKTKCDAMKAKATVGVIYTTYLPIYKDPHDPNNSPTDTSKLESNYTRLVLPYSANIGPTLSSCATSSQYYFQADDAADLNTAMQSLFAATLPSTARLTQ